MLARRLPPSPHDSGGGSRGTVKTRNPKPETDSEDFTSPGPIETRNPKPETRNRLLKLVSNCETETRHPKPETDSESGFQSTKPETRNPTAKVGFKRRNPKPETRNRQRKLVSIDETRNRKPETRNPKPTRIQLLGGSPDRNSISMDFYGFLWISTIQIWLHMDYASPTSSHIHCWISLGSGRVLGLPLKPVATAGEQ